MNVYISNTSKATACKLSDNISKYGTEMKCLLKFENTLLRLPKTKNRIYKTGRKVLYILLEQYWMQQTEEGIFVLEGLFIYFI